MIKGLQKTTLIDYPGKVACTLFLGGCNFRCGFCHNASLVLHPEKLQSISEDDFLAFLENRKNKLDGVCITGGEPTLYPGLIELCRKIKEMGFEIKLDTNGTHPDKIRALLDKKLIDYFALLS